MSTLLKQMIEAANLSAEPGKDKVLTELPADLVEIVGGGDGPPVGDDAGGL